MCQTPPLIGDDAARPKMVGSALAVPCSSKLCFASPSILLRAILNTLFFLQVNNDRVSSSGSIPTSHHHCSMQYDLPTHPYFTVQYHAILHHRKITLFFFFLLSQLQLGQTPH